MRGKQIGISQSHGLLVVPKIDTTMRSQIQRWISQLWMLSNLTDNGIPPSTTLATHIVLQMVGAFQCSLSLIIVCIHCYLQTLMKFLCQELFFSCHAISLCCDQTISSFCCTELLKFGSVGPEQFVETNGHAHRPYWRRGEHQLQNYHADSGPTSPDYASPPRFPV